MPTDSPNELSRLRWRCRRGMKELDQLLVRYLERHYERAPSVEQAAFRELLELQDPVLHGYLIGRETPENAVLSQLIRRVRGVVDD